MENKERDIEFLNVDDIKRFIEKNPSVEDQLLQLGDKKFDDIIFKARNASHGMTEEYVEREKDLQLFFTLYELAKKWVANLSEEDYKEFYSKHEGEPFDTNQIDPTIEYSECYMMNDWVLYGQTGSMRYYTEKELEENLIPELGEIKARAKHNALIFREDMKEIKEKIDDEKLNSFYEKTSEKKAQLEKEIQEIIAKSKEEQAKRREERSKEWEEKRRKRR